MNVRIKLTDTMADVAYKMSEGNPGSLNVIVDLMDKADAIDPDCGFPMLHILGLDTLGVYGPRIWMLYKDVCKEDLKNVVIVMRAHQMGLLPIEVLKERIYHTRGHAGFSPLDFDDLLSKLRTILPELCVTPVA